MTVSFRRSSTRSLEQARHELSTLRKELYTSRELHRRMIKSITNPASIGFLHQIIATNPEYEAELLRLSETMSKPMQQHIHNIIKQAKERYGAR